MKKMFDEGYKVLSTRQRPFSDYCVFIAVSMIELRNPNGLCMNHAVQAAAARRNAFQPKLGAAVCMQEQVMKLRASAL